jgi:hypothetical protein
MATRIASLFTLFFFFHPAVVHSNEGTPGTLTPHLDMYYSYNANEPFPPNPMLATTVSAASLPLGNNPLRLYDSYHNQFSLALVEFTYEKRFGTTAVYADFDFGQSADLNARIGSGTTRLVDESTKHIGQGKVIWTPAEVAGLSVEFGKMLSHVTQENFKAKDNWNYSRSLMSSFGSPVWHTGIRALYDVGAWQTGLMVYNGWNSSYDSNASKTLGARLGWSEGDHFRTAYNFIGGAEQDNESLNQRVLHDLNIWWRLNDDIQLAVESIYGSEQNVVVSGLPRDMVTWSGWALHGAWKVNDRQTVFPRVEWYNDNHGATLGNGEQKVVSATVTEAFKFADGMEPRLEIRYDKTNADGTFSRRSAAVSDQFTVTVALLYLPGTF